MNVLETMDTTWDQTWLCRSSLELSDVALLEATKTTPTVSGTEYLRILRPNVFKKSLTDVNSLQKGEKTVPQLKQRASLVFSHKQSLQSCSRAIKTQSAAWSPRRISLEDSITRMWKNAQKAVLEHSAPGYFNGPELFTSPTPPLVPAGQSFLTCSAEQPYGEKGRRESMDDSFFCDILDRGNVIAGIFDGHGGPCVSAYCAKVFKDIFCEYLAKNPNPIIYTVFEQVFFNLQKNVSAMTDCDNAGSTAVVSFIDVSTGFVYTATLGDCEANIYRKFPHGLQSIPLSCVRNWSSKKDFRKAVEAKPGLGPLWATLTPQARRFPSIGFGLNVSRVIGDNGFDADDKRVFSRKPKITIQKLHEKDLLLLACDGLKTYVSEQEIIDQVGLIAPSGSSITERLVHYAINEKNSHDNVSVIAIKILSS